MKLKMEVKNITGVLKNVSYAQKGMTRVFKDASIKEMEDMRDLAKRNLEEASMGYTGKKYWTGTLQGAIEANVIMDKPGILEQAVGINMEITAQTRLGSRVVKDYAIPVEKGHMTGIGETKPFPGYFYIERAFVELAPGMTNRLTKILGRVVRTPWGLRNIAKGEWAPKSTPKHLIQ